MIFYHLLIDFIQLNQHAQDVLIKFFTQEKLLSFDNNNQYIVWCFWLLFL